MKYITWENISRVLLVLIGYVAMHMLGQLSQIQKDLMAIKVDLVKVQASIPTEDFIRMIVRDEQKKGESR